MKELGSIEMRMERITKGAVLYKNIREGDRQVATTIYLRKSGLTEPYPTSIRVILRALDGVV